MPETLWLYTWIIAGALFLVPGCFGAYKVLRQTGLIQGIIFILVTVGLELALLIKGREWANAGYIWFDALTPAGVLAALSPLILGGFIIFFLWALEQKK